MTEEIRVREATIADLAEILRHRRAMFQEMGHDDPPAGDSGEAERLFRRKPNGIPG